MYGCGHFKYTKAVESPKDAHTEPQQVSHSYSQSSLYQPSDLAPEGFWIFSHLIRALILGFQVHIQEIN